MNIQKEKLTIGGVSRITGVHIETIRFYQRKKLINEPTRVSNKIRYYQKYDVNRIAFIKSTQGLGFGLDEVRELLYLEEGVENEKARKIVQQKLVELRNKIVFLQYLYNTLEKFYWTCERGKYNDDEKRYCSLIQRE
jgi:MerR family mercuric resistance operon transcriptional regulator